MPEIGEIKERTGLMGKDTEEFPLMTVRSHLVWNGEEWRPVPMGFSPEQFAIEITDWYWSTLGGRRESQPQYYVIDEHTLVYSVYGLAHSGGLPCGILQASILKGSPYSDRSLTYLTPSTNFRSATLEDFESFKVEPPPHYKVSTPDRFWRARQVYNP
jgi:hypothetical protein